MIDFGIDYRFSENFEFGHAAHVSRSILGRETRIRCYFCENRSLSIVMIDFGIIIDFRKFRIWYCINSGSGFLSLRKSINVENFEFGTCGTFRIWTGQFWVGKHESGVIFAKIDQCR
jgi:hypothetical protein